MRDTGLEHPDRVQALSDIMAFGPLAAQGRTTLPTALEGWISGYHRVTTKSCIHPDPKYTSHAADGSLSCRTDIALSRSLAVSAVNDKEAASWSAA